MNQVGMISVLLGLLMPLATYGEMNELIERKLAVNYTTIGPPKSFASPLFADKSFMYTICNFWWTNDISCEVHVVRFDGPEEVHSFKYEPSPGRGISTVLQPNFVRNGFFMLTTEFNVTKTYGVRSAYVSGFVFNPTLDKLFKLELPSDMYDQHIIGSGVESDELVVVLGNHTICGEFNQCMLRFNNEGQKIGEPIAFPIQYNKLQLLSRQGESVDKGLFGIGTVGELGSSFTQVFYVAANNEPIMLHKFDYSIGKVVFSKTGDLYGICVDRIHGENQMTGTIEYNCLQYDWKLNKTTHFNMNTTVERTGFSIVMSIKNLNINSLLLTSLECNFGQKEFNCTTARISVVNSYDQILRSKEILTDLECHDISSISSGVAEINDEYCFHLSCLDAVEDHSISYLHGGHLYVKCLPISDI